MTPQIETNAADASITCFKSFEWYIYFPASITNVSKNPKNAKAFLEMLEYTKPTPVNENYNYINDILREKTQSIFSGEKKAEEVFDYKTINKLESKL